MWVIIYALVHGSMVGVGCASMVVARAVGVQKKGSVAPTKPS